METKLEIQARIDELNKICRILIYDIPSITSTVSNRIDELQKLMESAPNDIHSNIIRSHKAICEVKQMGEKEAYGNDPAMYYSMGVAGESGELLNAIVKARRNGDDQIKVLQAIMSELPDICIYAHILAYVLDIDLPKLVNDKVEIVIQRAKDGYYGPPLKKKCNCVDNRGRRDSKGDLIYHFHSCPLYKAP